MKCDIALREILDADLAELDGTGSSELAAHVRTCEKCAMVAAQIIADTRVLARVATRAAVQAPRTRRIVRPVYTVAATLAAAALVLFTIVSRPDAVPTAAPVTPPRVATAISVPASSPVRSAPTPSRSARRVRVEPRRFADAVPVVATAMRITPVSETANLRPGDDVADDRFVAVAPPKGQRAAVMRSPDQRITVVWIY